MLAQLRRDSRPIALHLAIDIPLSLSALAYLLGALASIGLLVVAWQEWLVLPLDRTEVLAFVSGAWAVWLAARNRILNWPIGILNSIFFVVLFWQVRLYFDMSINVFYVLSGLYGWWIWTFGGHHYAARAVGHVGRREAALLTVAALLLTGIMWERGIAIDDAAPILDALTTALSLLAQWMLMKRQVETWYLWIAADLVYIPLYASKALPLTAILYTVFLLMCLRGLRDWRVALRRQSTGAAA